MNSILTFTQGELDYEQQIYSFARSGMIYAGNILPNFVFYKNTNSDGHTSSALLKISDYGLQSKTFDIESETVISLTLSIELSGINLDKYRISNNNNFTFGNIIKDGVYCLRLTFDNAYHYYSQIFCKKSPAPDVYQNLFNSLGFSIPVVYDNSGKGNNGILIKAACLQVTNSTIISFNNNIDLSGYSVTNSGTATLYIDNNTIRVTSAGTVYELKITHASNQSFIFPCCEGDLWQLHDINVGERAFLNTWNWTTQNVYFALLLLGGTKITSLLDTSKSLYVPYNVLGGIIHIENRSSNDWFNSNLYKVNTIINRLNVYYKCNTEHTSSSEFETDIANWTVL